MVAFQYRRQTLDGLEKNIQFNIRHSFTSPGTVTGFHGTTDFSPRVTKIQQSVTSVLGN